MPQTPWHRDDLNAELKRNSSFAVFRRAVGDNLEPVWPERWPTEALATRRDEIGSLSFARGYRLVPLADSDVPICLNWVRYWSDAVTPERTVLAIDPALSTNTNADRSALVVLARAGNQVQCWEALARRVNTPDLLQFVAAVDQRWKPDVILFEANAAFRGIAELMTQRASFGPKVKTVTQTKDKAARVASFSVSVENGTFALQGQQGHVHPAQQELLDEMTTFPVAEHDDLLDATAFGTAFLLDMAEPRAW